MDSDPQKITYGNKEIEEIPEFQPRYFQYYYYNEEIPILACNSNFYPHINYARVQVQEPIAPRISNGGHQYPLAHHPSYLPIEEIIQPQHVQQIYIPPNNPIQQHQPIHHNHNLQVQQHSSLPSEVCINDIVVESTSATNVIDIVDVEQEIPPQVSSSSKSKCSLHPNDANVPQKPQAPVRKSRDNLKKSKDTRIRSASAGRDRKTEMISRYWAYLFENLERSIAEMYDTCERQENILQCKEVVFMLENYARDFDKLIEYLNIKWNFEHTPAPMRPNSLAWEIRKPSLTMLPHTKAYKELLSLSDPDGQSLSLTGDGIPIQRKLSVEDTQLILRVGKPREKIPSSIQHLLQSPTATINLQQKSKGIDVELQTEDLMPKEDSTIHENQNTKFENTQTDEIKDEFSPLLLFEPNSSKIVIISHYSEQGKNKAEQEEEEQSIKKSVYTQFLLDDINNIKTSIEKKTVKCDEKVGRKVEEKVKKVPTPSSSPTSHKVSVNNSNATSNKEEMSISKLDDKSMSKSMSNSSSKEKSTIDSNSMIKSDEIIEGPKSFADKARDGIKRASLNSNSAATTKSYPANLNTLGGCNSSDDKTKKAGGVNYRSNIASRCRTAAHYRSNNASRCRTAANTTSQLSHQQSLTSFQPQQVAKPSKQSLSNQNTKLNYNSNNTSTSNAQKVVGERKISCADPKSSCSASKYASSFQIINADGSGDNNDKNKGYANSKAGVIRSKSMINPIGVGRGNKSNNSKNFGKQIVDSKRPYDLHENANLMQTPVENKRRHNIDEDGWEIVRARSNRSSKWSASTSSLQSTVSRGSIDKTIERGAGDYIGNCERKVSESFISPESNNNTQLSSDKQAKTSSNTEHQGKEKEFDDESSNDDEEIKQKDALLDNAMREEELLEEELRQVEKDFEEIEKRDEENYDMMTTSETEVVSPDLLDISKIPEESESSENGDLKPDKYYFVSVDGDKTLGIANVEDFSPREPGRIFALREKLLSPAKRDSAETLRKHQEKLAKAEKNREKLLKEQFKKYIELSEKFSSLNQTTQSLVQERAILLTKAEERRKRAEEKRSIHISEIRKKAHDEYSKQMEIKFINSFEMESKRHDLLASAQAAEERIQSILEERKQKIDERSVRAQAVIERQFQYRKKWNKKLEKIQEKRQRNEERIIRTKEEKAKCKAELAQEKARDRIERLQAIKEAKKAEKEELQKKILQKQEDTARRHDEQIEQIRQKAVELSTPRIQEDQSIPLTVRVCTLCKVIVQSEVQELAHLRGRSHLECVRKALGGGGGNKNSSLVGNGGCEGSMGHFGIKYIIDIQADKVEKGMQPDKNRSKTIKKLCKKTQTRLFSSGEEYENSYKENNKEYKFPVGDSKLKAKFQKDIHEIDRIIGLFNQDKGSQSLVISLDRIIKDVRKLTNKNKSVKDSLSALGAFQSVQKVLDSKACDLPQKTKILACQFLIAGTFEHFNNSIYILRSTCACTILQIMVDSWNALIPDDNRWILCRSPSDDNSQLPIDPLLEEVSELFFNLMNFIAHPVRGIGNSNNCIDKCEMKDLINRSLDITGYYVASGLVDRLSIYCNGIRGTIESQPNVASLIDHSLNIVTLLIYTLVFCLQKKAELNMTKKEEDTTQYMTALESSELAGSISMSYSILLHQGAPRSRITPDTGVAESFPHPPALESSTSNLVTLTLQLINALARFDLKHLQNLLGSEGISLQFRHIASQLLWQIIPFREDYSYRRILLELLMAIGYFTVANPHNQEIIQSGQTPTVLQQLCSLPKDFMEDPKFSKSYIPTLIVSTFGCSENQEILKQHGIDPKIHEEYMESEQGKMHPLIMKLQDLIRDKENRISMPKKKKSN